MVDLDDLQPEDREEASPARRYIRDNYDAMTRARERGVSWHQITDTMAEAGIATTAEGSPLGWRHVKSLYHTERYARGGKRKRRAAPVAPRPPKPAAPALADPKPTPAPAATPEPSTMPAADPELARRLNSLRTIEEVPPMAMPAGWRKRKGNEDG